MHKNIILWVAAAVITFLTGYFNSVTGDDLPLSGTFGIEGKKVTFKFDRVYDGKQPMQVLIRTDIDSLKGKLIYQTSGSGKWDTSLMKYNDYSLTGEMFVPDVPAIANYRVKLNFRNTEYILPKDNSVRVKVLGATSPIVKGLFWFCLLFALFLSVRTGLEFFADTNNEKKHGIFTAIFFILYGFVVSPLLISYQKGAISHSIPAPWEIWSLEHSLLPVLWIMALIMMFNSKLQKPTALITAILSLILFILIH